MFAPKVAQVQTKAVPGPKLVGSVQAGGRMAPSIVHEVLKDQGQPLGCAVQVEEDRGNPGQLQTAPDPTLGPLLQCQPDIPPPPPAYPSCYTWFSDFVGAAVDFDSLYSLTCKVGRERGFYVMWD